MSGAGSTVVAVDRQALWDLVMDEARLAAAIPGAETLRREDRYGVRVYTADVSIGVGPIREVWRVEAEFAETVEPSAMVLHGGATGRFGSSRGEGWVDLAEDAASGGTRVDYRYAILISGLVAKVGGRLLDAAADKLVAKFFARLAKAVAAERA